MTYLTVVMVVSKVTSRCVRCSWRWALGWSARRCLRPDGTGWLV